MLTIGRVTNLSTLASNVISHAWHDSRPGHIAYTTADGSLWTAFSDLQPRSLNEVFDPGTEVVAWGDWGFAISSLGEGTILLTPEGEIRTNRPGDVLTSRPDGWLVIAEDEVKMVSAGGGVRGLPASAQVPGSILSAAFAPSGDLLAIGGSDRVMIVPVEGEGVASRFDAGGANKLRWASDGRFVIAVGERGITVLDVERGGSRFLLAQHRITDVASIAIPGS